uniref:Kunitz/Bovine pancreatic trypsin inhibitor domain protein n=1 Tax=Rhabditophanes sp. KR3021 TaxID=114890 RepID=A0AC35U8I8_9BILA
MMFYYDTKSKACQPFMFQGCGGNENKFDSSGDCKAACSNVIARDFNGNKGVEKCGSGIDAATDSNGLQLTCTACPANTTCVDNKCCYDPQVVCRINYDAGKFPDVGSHKPMYYYSTEYHSCMLFTYYGSLGNPNKFADFKDCMKFCKPVHDTLAN